MPKITAKSLGLFGGLVRPIQALLGVRAASGVVLFANAAAALLWANLYPESYSAVFDLPLSVQAGGLAAQSTFHGLISDVLMALFFFVVGMEIKRELATGALSSVSAAMLPAIAALGGMAVPALIFLAFNRGGSGAAGWGIPMATDIAFCVGVLAMLDRRVPRELVVFVTALAVFDDIGGIIVIAVFYGHGVSLAGLLAAVLLTVLLFVGNRARVTNGLVYAGLGIALWYSMEQAGIHATLSGVIVGLMIPARPLRPPREVLDDLASHLSGLGPAERNAGQVLAIEEQLEDMEAPLDRFLHAWHPIVAWFVMPAFALANSGVHVGRFDLESLTSPVALGVALGLLAGKPIGIFSFTFLAVKLKLARLPGGASYRQLFAVSVVAGIGFTVALFIAMLAYPGSGHMLEQAKAGVLVGSLAAGVVGALLVRMGKKLPA